MRVLVLGVSTRAMVESAVRGGHDVVAVDFFGDRDQARLTESHALQRDLGLPATAEGLGEAAARIEADAVVYGSNLDNHPEVVGELARRRRLLGNPPEVLRDVRDWAQLRRFCREAGIGHPETLLHGEERRARRGRWLRKRIRSGGGHAITPWDGRALDDAHLLQAVVDGRPASVAFVADGKESRIFGITEQLLGLSALGGSGFAWCGNVLPLGLPAADAASVRAQLEHMVSGLTRRFGLRGVNGLDVVIGRDAEGGARPYLVEVNPRFTRFDGAGGTGLRRERVLASRRRPRRTPSARPRRRARPRRLRRQGDRLCTASDRRPRHGRLAVTRRAGRAVAGAAHRHRASRVHGAGSRPRPSGVPCRSPLERCRGVQRQRGEKGGAP